MKVLSLFDGMACGLQALKQAGVKVDDYYASEIDKYAIQVAKKNHPEIKHLGDVTKWKEWNLPKIDLLIGGSPCQGFSFAGKQLNFEDPRSKLFFTYVEILRHYKPKYFLLENVKMKKEYQDTISEYLGVEPIEINSALVSAQNRKRLYWCNCKIEQPEDKGILLKDVIEDGIVDRKKSYCIDSNYYKGSNLEMYYTKSRRQIVFKNKAQTILSTIYKENAKSMLKRNKIGLLVLDRGYWRKLTPIECERLQTLQDNYTEGVSNTQRYKMLGNGWTVSVIEHIFNNIKKEQAL